MVTTALDRRIEIDPEIVGGKPRIAGHRITVQDVVIWYERLGQRVDELAATHDLTHAGIHAALAYSFDHLREIDDSLHASEAWVETMKNSNRLNLIQAPGCPWTSNLSFCMISPNLNA